jgi:DNA primase catalytic core
MARIGEAELERLKASVSVAELVATSGVLLARQGADLAGLCPFHEDREPSLKVTPAKNLWHCFGCGAGGGPIDWVMKRQGVSFRHAVELLREQNPSLAADAVPSPVRMLAPPVSLDEDDAAVLERVVDFYQACLKRTPAALAYLEKRGIADPAAIETFKLGFADRTLGLRLPDKRKREGAALRTRLERVGLFRESGHEHFCGSLVIPVLDEAGQVAGMYGRKITEGLRAGTPLHLYLPGPHRGVWNLPGIAASEGTVILCEALIDALTFWCAGFRNVTAAYGVDGFTDAHLAAFRAHGVRNVLIAYDHDEAGDRGAAKLAERLAAAGIGCWRVRFPQGMDANAYALKVTPAAKSLGLLLRQSVWMGAGDAPPHPALLTPAALLGAESTAKPSSLAADSLPASAPVPALESPLVASAEIAARKEVVQAGSQSPASVLAAGAAPPADARRQTVVEVRDNETTIQIGARRYRVRGLDRVSGGDALKINLMAATETAFHVDTLDLYSAKARASFIEAASAELGITQSLLKADLGQVLLEIEGVQEARASAAIQPAASPETTMTAEDRAAALAFLREPDLLGRIAADFATCGLVGEETNRLVGYLAAVSRKLAAPLAVLVQSSSAAGKSSLMDAVLGFVPESERVRYSAITGQALFYMGNGDLRHKILAICEEEGARSAAYALKLLQSDGSLTIASTGKDAATGALVTQDYRVEGPVMLFLTTTAIEIDEELLNRCLVLSVDEGRAQTEAIHRLQRSRRTLQGLLAREAKSAILKLHQDAQLLLRPLAVVNPYADRLTFLSDRTRARRDHEKYLTLIDTIALLHQHQRPIRHAPDKNGSSDLAYIEVTLSDIAHANRLAHEVLGRSLDALPPQSRRLLGLIADWVKAQAEADNIKPGEVRFTRRVLREATGWGDTQLKLHLARLVELEHLLVHRAERGQGFVYELLYDGDGTAAPHLSGLIDPEALSPHGYDARRSGLVAERSALEGKRAAASRPLAGGWTAPGQQEEAAKEEGPVSTFTESADAAPKPLFPPAARLNGSHAPNPIAHSSLAASH